MTTLTINGKTYIIDEHTTVDILINDKRVEEAVKLPVLIKIEGDPANINSHLDVVVNGNVQGNVRAGTDINVVGDVGGDVQAGTDVRCGNVAGDVKSGTDTTCGNVGGSVKAGMDLNYRR